MKNNISASLVCIASGAFIGTANANITTHDSDYNLSENDITYDITTSNKLKPSGVKYARLQTLGGLIGSSNSSGVGKAGSTMESCYSNCHAVPTTPAQRCQAEGYKATSCDGVNFVGDTLSGVCPYNSSYYKTCVDCASLKSKALDSTYDSGDMFAHDLDWEGTVKPVLATGIIGSGPVSISAVPWYSSLSAAQMVINGTATDIKKYNDTCNTNMTWSCYSNCHTESAPTCGEYLDSIGVKHVSTKEEIDALMSLAGSEKPAEVAVLADITTYSQVETDVFGPKHYSYASCQSTNTPTLTLKSSSRFTQLGDINISSSDTIFADNIEVSGNVKINLISDDSIFASSGTAITVTRDANLTITNNSSLPTIHGGLDVEENAVANIQGYIDANTETVSNAGTLVINTNDHQRSCIETAVIYTDIGSTTYCKAGRYGALNLSTGILSGTLNIDAEKYEGIIPLLKASDLPSTSKSIIIKGTTNIANITSDIKLVTDLYANKIILQDSGSIINTSTTTANLIFSSGLNLGSASLISGFKLADGISYSTVNFTAAAGARIIKDGVCKKAPTSTTYSDDYESSWVACDGTSSTCSTYQSSPWVVNGSTVYSLCQAYGLIPSSTTATCGGVTYNQCQASSTSTTTTCTTSAASCNTGYTLCTGYSTSRCMADTSTMCNCMKIPSTVSVSYTGDQLCKYCAGQIE